MSPIDARPMPTQPPRPDRAASRPAEAPREARRAYRSPQLEDLGTADALIEILGPAQASYGTMGP